MDMKTYFLLMKFYNIQAVDPDLPVQSGFFQALPGFFVKGLSSDFYR